MNHGGNVGLGYCYLACSLVGFLANKPGWCWFGVRGKHCWLTDKPWLKPTSEQANYPRLFV